jgi:hypothetical protein
MTAIATPPAVISSSLGVICLLDEEHATSDFKVQVLKQVATLVDQFWAEIAHWLPQIEALSEDVNFPQQLVFTLAVPLYDRMILYSVIWLLW